MAVFKLNDLFENTFGFSPDDEIEVKEEDLVTVTSDEKYYKENPHDVLGRVVFMPVTINGLFLPYCWFTISGGKKIVSTDLTERRGAVHEYISDTDLKINIKGFVFNHDGSFPESQVKELQELWAVNQAVEIDCPLTDLFLLTSDSGAQDKVIIENWRLLDNKGKKGVRGYEMNLITDQELELEIV